MSNPPPGNSTTTSPALSTIYVSSPVRPVIVSAPAPPSSVLPPASPVRVSAPEVPVMVTFSTCAGGNRPSQNMKLSALNWLCVIPLSVMYCVPTCIGPRNTRRYCWPSATTLEYVRSENELTARTLDRSIFSLGLVTSKSSIRFFISPSDALEEVSSTTTNRSLPTPPNTFEPVKLAPVIVIFDEIMVPVDRLFSPWSPSR